MSTIASPVKKIQDLNIEQMPSNRAVTVVKATRVDGHFVLLGDKGQIYTTMSPGHMKAYYSLGKYQFTGPMMRGLNRLGVITRSEVDKHIKAANQRDEQSRLLQAQSFIKNRAKRAGVQLTDVQLKAMSIGLCL